MTDKDRGILYRLIEFYQNDFKCLCEDEDYSILQIVFAELIIEIIRYANDFRYCTNRKCPCSPESQIRRLHKQHREKLHAQLKYHEDIIEFLEQFHEDNSSESGH